MRLVGISGLAGAGKDTAADALVQRLGFTRVALADPMKRACAEWFGWDEDRLWGSSSRRNAPDPLRGGVTPRRALQLLGTEFGRAAYPNLWVEIVIRDASKLLLERETWAYDRATGVTLSRGSRCRGVVVPDVRFRNELEAIMAAGGYTIRVSRPGAGLEGDAALHASEVEQLGIRDEEFDAVVINNGTIADLHERVCEVVESLMGVAA